MPCSEEVCGVGGKGEVVRNTWGVGGVLGGKQPREVFRGLQGARRQRHGAALCVLSISPYDAMCVLSIYHAMHMCMHMCMHMFQCASVPIVTGAMCMLC